MKKICGVVLLISSGLSVAYAEGLQNFEQVASAMGNAYAGTAAAAEDASTGFFNPAALILFKTRQITYSTAALFNDVTFNGRSTWQSNFTPIPGFLSTQQGSVNGGKTQYFPAFNEAIPFNDRFAMGLNVGIPFSFASNYGSNSVVRYEGTRSHFYVVDITPSFAYLITPKWSAGIGADFDYAHANFDSIIGFPSPFFSGNTLNAFDTYSENKGGNWGIGWHGGVLYQYSPATRFGLAYHSQVTFNMSGESDLTGSLTGLSSVGLINQNLHMKIKTPDSANFSVYHQLNPQWELVGSVVYTDWNKLNNINLNNMVYVINGQPIIVNKQIPLHLRNSWYTAIGANYLLNSRITLRGGLAYDESPTTQATSIIVPDENKLILGTGFQFNLNKMWGFDVGYQHWFYGNSNRNTTVTAANGIIHTAGQLRQNTNIVGMQITWNIGLL
jgi:long-chain fatty acid transport protein